MLLYSPASSADFATDVIYGDDDRHEVFELPSRGLQQLARSTAVFFRKKDMRFSKSGAHVPYKSFGEDENLCHTERFYDQPVPGKCTGFLIGHDTILTAGHCIDADSCADFAIVFDFQMINSWQARTRFDHDQIYQCRRILQREEDEIIDYALVQLDRSVTGRLPIPLPPATETTGKPRVESIFAISHLHGLPAKVSLAGSVRQSHSDYFEVNLDVAAGSSGAPVFDQRSGQLIGLIVGGEDDFEDEQQATAKKPCRIVKRCADGKCAGEDVLNLLAIPKIRQFTRSQAKKP